MSVARPEDLTLSDCGRLVTLRTWSRVRFWNVSDEVLYLGSAGLESGPRKSNFPIQPGEIVDSSAGQRPLPTAE